MLTLADPTTAVMFTVWLLLMLLTTNEPGVFPNMLRGDECEEDPCTAIVENFIEDLYESHNDMRTTLHQFRFFLSLIFLEEDLGYWVKPRSTTWISRFMLEEYDNARWVEIFRFTKLAVLALVDVLRPDVQRQNTWYSLAILVLIRVACTLFKLSYGANMTMCSELFVIGRRTVSMVLSEVVNAISDTLRHKIMWPTGDRLRETEAKFYKLCGLPRVVGSIDGMHVAISKPIVGPHDYYYFKSLGYSINCQAIVDSDKRFLDLYIGMPISTDDSRMLRRSSLYNLAMHHNLLGGNHAFHGFSPYLIGDLGYPILPWLMIPHRSQAQLSVAESLFNRRLRKGHCVVENAFGILKQSFRELLVKSELHVAILPDVILCCTILYNILLAQSHEEVEELLQVLWLEGLDGEVVDDDIAAGDANDANHDEGTVGVANNKRAALGVFLSMQRRQHQ